MYRCVLEENQLKRAIKELDYLGNEGSKILEICSNKKIITGNDPDVIYIFVHEYLNVFSETEKVSIYDLNKVLNVLTPYSALVNIPKLNESNIEALKALHQRTIALNEKIDDVIHRAAMPRIKRFRYNMCVLSF